MFARCFIGRIVLDGVIGFVERMFTGFLQNYSGELTSFNKLLGKIAFS